MSAERPSTPPRAEASTSTANPPRAPLTPDQIRKIEESRLKAKALREQREAEARRTGTAQNLNRTPSGFIAGQKQPYGSISTSNVPSNLRDAAHGQRDRTPGASGDGYMRPKRDDIQPARKFLQYVEYDFSKMTDTKGGFLTAEDDPHNKALYAPDSEEKPAHMTLKEWERHQLIKSLRDQKAGPYEPGLSVLKREESKMCRECGSMEIDWKWEECFGCAVCSTCKEKFPEKYSLLTKTEAKEDYLLTDPELKDEELLPHLERPNPHKSTWNNMMLYLRYQVEEYAFSDKKWGSPGALDAEFEKRESDKKRRKEDKFRSKLQELKKKTRVEAYRRSRQAGGGGGTFGDEIGNGAKHKHEWGRTVENPTTGIGVKTCIECGMEVEELEF
ncbi:DNA repair protein rad14 [Xylona heveae TC161]|uniref:DNA repair protein RAD14 n=1 Tax=Xylona heveae (strain CBS 132557 / TC161) TaxID=1328760 RepID=A0A165AIF6_XYLHT|nr:DNA repair protein rad14 [Xylona heveae TC161]KZF20533.1 DNA repair protein rad14 [Xylona heveae TC161]